MSKTMSAAALASADAWSAVGGSVVFCCLGDRLVGVGFDWVDDGPGGGEVFWLV